MLLYTYTLHNIVVFWLEVKSYNDHSSIISRRELQLFLVMITSTTIIQCYMRTRSVLTSLVSLSLQLLFFSLPFFSFLTFLCVLSLFLLCISLPYSLSPSSFLSHSLTVSSLSVFFSQSPLFSLYLSMSRL